MLKYRASIFVYLWIGGLSALINWAVFYVFSTFLYWHYALAAVAAFTGATAVNYFLSEKVGFLSRERSRFRQVLGVYLVSTLGLGVDLLVLAMLHEFMDVDVMASKIAGTAAAFIVNFAGRQFVVFVRQPRWPSLSELPREIAITLSRDKPHSPGHRNRS